jgi:xylulokinase
MVWTQIKADITGKPIHVSLSDHATTLGAAILGGVGIGIYSSFHEAVQKTVHIQRTYIPNPDNYSVYQKYFSLYIELYRKLRKSYNALYQIANNQ